MKTKWVVAIAIATWMCGVATHMALMAVVPQEEAECLACEEACCGAPAPDMNQGKMTTTELEEQIEMMNARNAFIEASIKVIEARRARP